MKGCRVAINDELQASLAPLLNMLIDVRQRASTILTEKQNSLPFSILFYSSAPSGPPHDFGRFHLKINNPFMNGETPTPETATPEDGKTTPKSDADPKERRRRSEDASFGVDTAAGATGAATSGTAGAAASSAAAGSMTSSKEGLNDESMTSFGMHSPDSPPGDEGMEI